MDANIASDGIHGLLPEEMMSKSARKLRDAYAIKPGAPIFQKEFGFYCLDAWKTQGLPEDVNLQEFFGYDEPGSHNLWQLGWTTPMYYPTFEVKIIETRGECEIEQDRAGRHVLFFKGRRNGFMPEYVNHPLKDRRSWEETLKWRLDPSLPERIANINAAIPGAVAEARKGKMIVQDVIGGYMYLRSMIGPEELLYMFYDDPELIHDCMKTWLELADSVTARHQQQVTIDELYLGEDICYNHGALISPEMVREFLIPYYQQLISNIKSRQLDKNRHLYIHLDTDGFSDPVIPLYQEIGMDVLSPFEVASNCDVVRTGKEYPELVISGGIDKRILAQDKKAIDRHLDYIMPTMYQRGGYIPTCDHGVPEEVSLENYQYYRRRILEYAN